MQRTILEVTVILNSRKLLKELTNNALKKKNKNFNERNTYLI